MKRSSLFRSLVPAAFVVALGYAPAARAQATAKVTCKDGTTATTTGRGACSGHGGVATAAATKAVARSEKAAARSAAKSDEAAAKAKAKGEKATTKAAEKSEKASARVAEKSEKASAKAAEKSEKASGKAAEKSEKATTKAAARSEKAGEKSEKAGEKSEKAGEKNEKAADRAATRSLAAAGGSAEVTAKCKDGTTSKAKSRRGACSGHGGVASWLK